MAMAPYLLVSFSLGQEVDILIWKTPRMSQEVKQLFMIKSKRRLKIIKVARTLQRFVRGLKTWMHDRFDVCVSHVLTEKSNGPHFHLKILCLNPTKLPI